VAVEARREEAVARGEHGEVLLAEGDVRGREAPEARERARRAQLARAPVEAEAGVVAPEAEQRVGRGEDDGGVGGAPGHGVGWYRRTARCSPFFPPPAIFIPALANIIPTSSRV
jgi:hypothetical protein